MTSSKRKKARRAERHRKNVQAENDYKREAWESGKLIEENHNRLGYSKEYTENLATRLFDIVRSLKGAKKVVSKYQMYKEKIIALILYWSPDVKKDDRYYYLKESLEVYWDNPENLNETL